MRTTKWGLLEWACAAACLMVLLLPLQVEAQQKGHAVTATQIQINNQSQWGAWEVAGGIADISAAGVRPTFMRRNINAARDAEKFSFAGVGGAVATLNQGEAGNVIDGDISTTWGPDPDSPLKDWAITVNLGRIVIGQKIVVRFAEEGQGDPFLQFKVLVWRQGPSRAWSDRKYNLEGTDIPNYWEIGRTIRPNKNERVFEFEPPTSNRGKDDTFFGDPIELVQIVATDSDFDRAEEMASKEAYDGLPAAQRGVVEYYRKEKSGRESQISQAEYEALADPARKGPVRYFRKEIPRVAEIEVWTLGDNLNLGAGDRGAFLTVDTNAGPKDLSATVTDGNYTTGHNGSIFDGTVYEFFEDLGALFWIDTLQFIVDGSGFMDTFRLDISDGTLAPDGSIKWTRIGESLGRKAFREFRTDPAKVRYVRGLFENAHRTYMGFTEVMLYGQGFVPEVELTSDLIQLGGSKNLISIEWEADAPPGTSVEVQTRTGNVLLEEKVFHDTKGNVVTEKRYKKLPKKKKGEITSFFKASPDWVPWSTSYAFSGEGIKSPSPREYMLVRALLKSDGPDVAATLKSVIVNMSDPLADKLLGEVSPNRIQALDQLEDLSFFIQPIFGSRQQGFDEIMIESSTGTLMDLVELRMGSQNDFANGQPQSFSADQLEVMTQGADTLWFKLPETAASGLELIEVGFRPTIFSNSASFRASVQDSDSPGFWQRVDEGDATELVNSQLTTVLALKGSEVIKDMNLASEVMTPNGDGVNDVMKFNFDVARVNVDKDIKLTIYDLSGVLVKEIAERRPDPRGSYEMVWSGDDRSGQLVPPGTYVARIEVDVDSDSASKTSVARVVYVAY